MISPNAFLFLFPLSDGLATRVKPGGGGHGGSIGQPKRGEHVIGKAATKI